MHHELYNEDYTRHLGNVFFLLTSPKTELVLNGD